MIRHPDADVDRAAREAEEALAARLHTVLGWDVRLTEHLARQDFLIDHGGRLIGVGELKCRSRRYPQFMCGAAKLDRLMVRGELGDVPAYLFVRFPPDGAYYWRIVTRANTRDRRPGGRYDRHDPYDVETCVYWDTRLFGRVP